MIQVSLTATKFNVKRVVELQKKLTLLEPNPTKWLNTLKKFVGDLPTNCLSVFNHFVGLALKGLNFG